MILYHYCCQHSRRAITDRGFLRPSDPLHVFAAPLVWLTDQTIPDRVALGLTMHHMACDRIAYRYVCDDAPADPWLASPIRAAAFAGDAAALAEFEAGRKPARWYVARRPVWAIRDRAYRPPAEPARPGRIPYVDADTRAFVASARRGGP